MCLDVCVNTCYTCIPCSIFYLLIMSVLALNIHVCLFVCLGLTSLLNI